MARENTDISMRYFRQYGLVHQANVEDLNVLVTGYNEAFPYVMTNLALLGVGVMHGAIVCYIQRGRKVEEDDVEGQLLFKQEDVGSLMRDALPMRVKALNTDTRVRIVEDESELDASNYSMTIVLPSHAHPKPKMPKHCIPIYGIVTRTSAYIGKTMIKYEKYERNVMTPSLASVCGGLIAQELLRETRCLRKTEILQSWLSINFLVRSPGIAKKIEDIAKTLEAPADGGVLSEEALKKIPFDFRLTLGAEPLHAHPSNKVSEDEYIFRITIPGETMFARLITDSVEVVEPYESANARPIERLLFSPIDARLEGESLIEPPINIPTKMEGKKLFVVGVGGLGSWLTALFSVSNTSNCELVIVDPDIEVEEHNLNRQVLYDVSSIGKKKAEAASEKLAKLNPRNRISAHVREVQSGTVTSVRDNATMTLEDYEKMNREMREEMMNNLPADEEMRKLVLSQNQEVLNFDPVLGHEAQSSDAIISCLDNMQTRYYLSALARIAGKPLINAGGQEFRGEIELYEHDGECMICRKDNSIKVNNEKVSCTEQGKVPVSSIVTTISTVSSIQSAITIARLAGVPGVKKWVLYFGKSNAIMSITPKKKDGCPAHLEIENIK